MNKLNREQKTSLMGMILFIIFTGWSYYNNLQDKDYFENEISQLENKLSSTTDVLKNTELEKRELIEKLDSATSSLATTQRKLNKVEREADKLEKILETDKELLQKYSKVYFLNEHYTPKKLAEISSDFWANIIKPIEIHYKVEDFLSDLLKEAKEDGIDLKVISGYRSFAYQTQLKNTYKVIYGSGANTFAADQGYSEHQLGTAVDFSTSENYGSLETDFEKTKAFEWLHKYAYRYGFVLSYPKGNSYYQYEPWHWRFVGTDLARLLYREKKNFYDLDQREINEYLGDIFD